MSKLFYRAMSNIFAVGFIDNKCYAGHHLYTSSHFVYKVCPSSMIYVPNKCEQIDLTHICSIISYNSKNNLFSRFEKEENSNKMSMTKNPEITY